MIGMPVMIHRTSMFNQESSMEALESSLAYSIQLMLKIAGVVFLGEDNSELVMVPQTMHLRLHRWQTIS